MARAMTLLDEGFDAPKCIYYAHRCRIPSSWWLDAPCAVAFVYEDRCAEAQARRDGEKYLAEGETQKAIRSFSITLYMAPNKDTLFLCYH